MSLPCVINPKKIIITIRAISIAYCRKLRLKYSLTLFIFYSPYCLLQNFG